MVDSIDVKSVTGDANVRVQFLAKFEGFGSVVSRVVEADVGAVALVAAVDGDVGGAVVFHDCSMAGSAGFRKGADRPIWSVYRTSGVFTFFVVFEVVVVRLPVSANGVNHDVKDGNPATPVDTIKAVDLGRELVDVAKTILHNGGEPGVSNVVDLDGANCARVNAVGLPFAVEVSAVAVSSVEQNELAPVFQFKLV